MTWKPALSLTELKQNNRQNLLIEGHKILFIWHDEQIHAVQAQCPHLKLPLTKATINEQGEIVCPFHKSSFELKDGKSMCWSPWPKVLGPLLGKVSKPTDLRIYPTKIEGDQVLVKIVA